MLWLSIGAALVQILALIVSCLLCRNIVNFEIEPVKRLAFLENFQQFLKHKFQKPLKGDLIVEDSVTFI